MVMNGQNDALGLFLGGKNNECVMGVFEHILERDQQLDDIIDPYDDMSLLREMGFETTPAFTGDICSEVEIVSEVVEIPQEAPEMLADPTPSTTQSEPWFESQNQAGNFFQFPTLAANEELTTIDFQSFLNDVVDENNSNQLTDAESSTTYAPSPFSPTSPAYSLPPQTPDTASSLGSSSGNIPSFVKAGLKNAIKSKRQREGKGELKVEFIPPPAEQETKKLQKEKSKQQLEIQQLLDERERLMEIINVHRVVCPKFRSKSSAI